MKKWWVAKIVKVVLLALIAMAALSVVVMVLWNAVIPSLFNGPSVTFWQAVGLLLLSHILLRGWGPWRHGNGWKGDRWRRRFEEKLAAMTPEEREKFRQEWKQRCGPYRDWTGEKTSGA